MDYAKKPDKTMLKRKLERYKSAFSSEMFVREVTDLNYINAKKEEIMMLVSKYNIMESQANSILKFYLFRKDLPNGDILKSIDLLSLIMKVIYEIGDEEISDFLNSNSFIMKLKYSDFRFKLAIFNHIGILEDVIFKAPYYLTYEFTLNNFDIKSLYSLVTKYDIKTLDDLQNIIKNILPKDLMECKNKFPLSAELACEFDKELVKTINRCTFRYQYKQRRSLKNGN